MGKLRVQLGLEGPAGYKEWQNLKKFIDKEIPAYIDLNKGPILRQHHNASIERFAQHVCTNFASLFSNPKSGSSVRVVLENYIMSIGNELRIRQQRKRAKAKHRSKQARRETRDPPKAPRSMVVAQCAEAQANALPLQERAYGSNTATGSNLTPLYAGLFPRYQETKMEPAMAKPSPSLFPIPSLSSGSHQVQPHLQTSQPTRKPATDSKDGMTLRPIRCEVGVEHDGIHDFLASCEPRLTHLYPYLLNYGCTNMGYLKVMSEWSDGDIQTVVENLKTVKVEDANAKPIDWDVLRHYIRKLKV